MDRMKARLKTPEGRPEYGNRKSVVVPVFGIIKEVLKCRRFLLRGMKKAKGEWTLACMAYNLKRMNILKTLHERKHPEEDNSPPRVLKWTLSYPDVEKIRSCWRL
jgi:hypothetical protein